MSFNAGSIVATLKANIDGFKQDLDKAVSTTKSYGSKMSQSFSGLNSSIEKHKDALQGVALKLGVIGAAAGVLTKQIVDLASDQNEVINKTNAIFGDAADEIMQKSKNAAQTVGDSTTAYLDMASAVGNLIVPMGFAQDEAAGMSDKMVRLAADLGSFNNAPTAEVLEAIKAGLVGSSEPLRRFGIQLSVARIEEEALASGLIKHKDEMTNLIKAQATMNIIMKDSTAAQGDFAKTSNDLANSTKIMWAEFENFRTELGVHLLPIALQVVTTLRGIIERFNELSPATQKIIAYSLALTAAIAGLAAPLLLLVTFIPAITAGFAALPAAMAAVSAAVSGMLLPITLVVSSITALYFAWQTNFFGIQEITNNVFNTIQSIFVQVMAIVMELVQSVLQTMQIFWQEHGDIVIQIISFIGAVFIQTLNNMLTIAQTVLIPLLKLFVTAFGQILSVVGATIGFVISLFSFNRDAIYNAAFNMMLAIDTAAKEVMNAMISVVGSAINKIINMIREMGTFLSRFPGFDKLSAKLRTIQHVKIEPFDTTALKKNVDNTSDMLGDMLEQVKAMGDISIDSTGAAVGVSGGGGGGSTAKAKEEKDKKEKAIDWEKEAEKNLKELADKRKSITKSIDDIDDTIGDIDKALKDKKNVGNEAELKTEREKLLKERAELNSDINEIDKAINRADSDYARELRAQLEEDAKQAAFNDRLGYVDQLIGDRVAISDRSNNGQVAKAFDGAKFTDKGITIQINDSLVADEESARDLLEKAFGALNLAT